MIIQLYSDLHLEYLKSTLKFESKSDILILAGDIGQIHLPSYKFFIDYVSDNWEKTFIVLGNHEYYSDTYTYSELRAKYHLFFEGYSNVTLLDKSCEIYKDIQFMGCTLWGNYPDECDRNYATNRKLKNHKQLVHQRVKCDECGKEICNSFILKRHKASVHGIIPKDAYQCEKCTSFFSTQTSLDKHVNSKH